jgi:hypothetical protein
VEKEQSWHYHRLLSDQPLILGLNYCGYTTLYVLSNYPDRAKMFNGNILGGHTNLETLLDKVDQPHDPERVDQTAKQKVVVYTQVQALVIT